jgi:hypothetical protein
MCTSLCALESRVRNQPCRIWGNTEFHNKELMNGSNTQVLYLLKLSNRKARMPSKTVYSCFDKLITYSRSAGCFHLAKMKTVPLKTFWVLAFSQTSQTLLHCSKNVVEPSTESTTLLVSAGHAVGSWVMCKQDGPQLFVHSNVRHGTLPSLWWVAFTRTLVKIRFQIYMQN